MRPSWIVAVPLLVAVGLGCTAAEGPRLRPGANVDGDDTGDVPVGDCAPDSPWPLTSADDVGVVDHLASGGYRWLDALGIDVLAYADWAVVNGDGCVLVTVAGDTTTVSDVCATTDGVELWGTASFVLSSADDGSVDESSTYAGFHFNDLGAQGSMNGDVDGSLTYVADAFGDAVTTLDATATVNDAADLDGEYTWRGVRNVTSAGWTEEDYVDVARQPYSAAIGDACLSSRGAPVDACDEPDSVDAITGSAVASITWDGSTACDQCGDVTLGGRDVGSYCQPAR